ncbi:MAG: hypothetical protein Fur0010_07910 [Bdellovibrio sp.]
MKRALPYALLLASVMTSPLMAQDDRGLLGGDFRVAVDGEINTSGMYGSESGRVAHLKDSYVTLSGTFKDKIRAVITADLSRIFRENKVELTDDFSLEEFIKEAYIEIREVGGAPVAIIVGKQPMAFGQNVQSMPIFSNNPLASLQEINEVMGVTVELSEGLFGLFDMAEVSAFETQGGDLQIGKIDGVSVRLSKMLTDQWLLTLSHAEMGNSHLSSGHERRTSIGLIGETQDGMLVGWVEGMYFSNNPQYPNANFGITAGGSIRVHETTDVIVEYTWIEKEVSQIALGVKTALTSNMTVGAEVRYNNYVERKDDIVFGINVTYSFGTSGNNRNENYLFGEKK